MSGRNTRQNSQDKQKEMDYRSLVDPPNPLGLPIPLSLVNLRWTKGGEKITKHDDPRKVPEGIGKISYIALEVDFHIRIRRVESEIDGFHDHLYNRIAKTIVEKYPQKLGEGILIPWMHQRDRTPLKQYLYEHCGEGKQCIGCVMVPNYVLFEDGSEYRLE